MCRTSHSDNLGRRPVRWTLLSLPATFHSFHIVPALDLEIHDWNLLIARPTGDMTTRLNTRLMTVTESWLAWDLGCCRESASMSLLVDDPAGSLQLRFLERRVGVDGESLLLIDG
jgi:hypothetical protein